MKARDGHRVGREQRKENLVDGALAALRLPSRSAPCIMRCIGAACFESECIEEIYATTGNKFVAAQDCMTACSGKAASERQPIKRAC